MEEDLQNGTVRLKILAKILAYQETPYKIQ